MPVPNKYLYELMMEIDRHEDLDDHPIRKSDAYQKAVVVLGWNIDWEKLSEDKLA